MNAFGTLVRATVIIVMVTSFSIIAQAQTARGGSGPSAQILQQLQQLGSERTALQTENARLKKERDDIRKERDVLKETQQAVNVRVRSSEVAFARCSAAKESAEQEVQQLKDKMQELIGKFRETAQTLRDVESERSSAKQTVALREQDLKACSDHNAALYKLNREVLDRLEHQSIWSRAARTEPFTKIKRAQLENLLDDYKSRADDERLNSPAPSPSAAAQPTQVNSSPAKPD